MNTKTKKQVFAFKQAIIDLILKLGATKTDRAVYEYQLMTPYGNLLISPMDDWIATCFEEPKKVPSGIKINRYSGKWNFHPQTPDQSWVDFFEISLARAGVNILAESLARAGVKTAAEII